ncbi:ABC transporter permease [Poseidonocella sp. HB161398]|uniref:ABC transporter permease n=1 Tax=Poseidonocella sp. HB161398 TaxID=2320855 RepID=UPI0011096E8C|nr:ABC transporter permease [Poseidonocella sp. HB161398]
MRLSGTLSRLAALTRKETRQMLRDRSNLMVGFLLPLVLILLFGYGLSFDVKDARIAVVMQNDSLPAREAAMGLTGSDYLSPVWIHSMQQAEEMMMAGEVDAILRVPHDFLRQLALGDARVQLILNGVDSNTASSVESYVSGALAVPFAQLADRRGGKAASSGQAVIVQRTWFNEPGESTWFLVPGLIVLILTLVGALLTSLLVAREWERGTMESLFVTPVRPLELVLSKLAPYMVIGAIDLAMCLATARWLFEVPMRGSLAAIVGVSMLYLLVSLSLGLLISAAMRNQFAASQLALLTSFMPAIMLSGFVFDLRNVPVVIQVVSQFLPATHFMGLIKTLFMAGDNWPEIWRTSAILALYAVILIALTRRALKKKLD